MTTPLPLLMVAAILFAATKSLTGPMWFVCGAVASVLTIAAVVLIYRRECDRTTPGHWALFCTHYAVARRYVGPLRATRIALAFVRAAHVSRREG